MENKNSLCGVGPVGYPRVPGPCWGGAGGDQRTYSPVNPKDMQAIVKAIADRGINSAMVSTLIDSVFGGDDMLPFDIKQTCRLIFDGAGMIVFKQEWEDNCVKQLALVTGADCMAPAYSG